MPCHQAGNAIKLAAGRAGSSRRANLRPPEWVIVNAPPIALARPRMFSSPRLPLRGTSKPDPLSITLMAPCSTRTSILSPLLCSAHWSEPPAKCGTPATLPCVGPVESGATCRSARQKGTGECCMRDRPRPVPQAGTAVRSRSTGRASRSKAGAIANQKTPCTNKTMARSNKRPRVIQRMSPPDPASRTDMP